MSGGARPARVHNGSAVLIVLWPAYKNVLGITRQSQMDHLPPYLIALGLALVIAGILLCRTAREDRL